MHCNGFAHYTIIKELVCNYLFCGDRFPYLHAAKLFLADLLNLPSLYSYRINLWGIGVPFPGVGGSFGNIFVAR